MTDAVPTGKLISDVERPREPAQRQTTPVSTNGDSDGLSELAAQCLAASPLRVFAVEDVTDAMAEAIANTHMDPRHAHLDALLDRVDQ